MKIIMNEKELELLKSAKSHILIQNMFFENDLSFLFALLNEYSEIVEEIAVRIEVN